MVYDWRGDRRFRLIPVASPRSASPAGTPPPPACGSPVIDPASSPFNVVAEYSASCTIVASATIWDIGGDVGIGTDAPSVTLEVNGSVKFDSTVNGAIGNPSGVVYHVDDVKYSTSDVA